MSSIIYYSNFCDKSKTILTKLAKSKINEDIHFICIDKRIKTGPATWHIVLETGDKVLLPPQVNRVPALLLLNKGHQVLYGDQILQHLQPLDNAANAAATGFNGEPCAFSLCGGELGGFGVVSDTYSYLDQTPDELAAKDGTGGLRQLHNYATIDFNQKIETPPDTYSPDKIGQISVEQMQQQRMNEVKIENSPLNPDQGRRQQQQQQQAPQQQQRQPYQEQQFQQYYPPQGPSPQMMALQQQQQQQFITSGNMGGQYRAPPQQMEYSRMQQAPSLQQQQSYQQPATSQFQYNQPYQQQQYSGEYRRTTRQNYAL